MQEAVLDAGEGSWLREFDSESRFWSILCWVSGTVALLKGLSFPSTWAATQAQLDYRDGFVKRGLFGTLVTAPLHLNHYNRFALAAFAILALALLLLVFFIEASGVLQRVGHGEVVALFVSSAAVMYLGSLVGYADVVLLALTLGLLLVRSPWVRLAAALPLCTAAILVHEAYLLLFLPVILFSFFADAVELRMPVRTAMVSAAALAGCCLLATVLVAVKASASDALADRERTEIAARVNFPVRADFFQVLTRSAATNVSLIRDNLRDRYYPYQTLSAFVLFAPVVGLLLLYLRGICRGSGDTGLLRYGWHAAVFASLTPMLMHLLGFDSQRWCTFTCIAAFLVLGLLVRALPGRHFAVSPALKRATTLVMLLSMAGNEGLLMTHGNEYPFLKNMPDLFARIRAHDFQPSDSKPVVLQMVGR